ncbi:class I SAM-dependent methyltransferase [Mucilaginibacter sp. UR6-11]|uniref:class I SAM-dependent methyltransferase n=1 Tax=Mucilaginibacter sp. UR6-11 TaxID=1435644 RepID=UPI001E4E1DF8|nr:class I SAM-dependent methyltransferase [Mucilaginibacter sp. UR6-11]MCC8427178.1 methyltransferase domain-containing protein [Mucilaginibacter sp. UR6-11]
MNTVTATVSPVNSLLSALKKTVQHALFFNTVKEKKSVEAYDLWAKSYDVQPGNLMLDLDEEVFTQLLAETDITGKQVADIGCGTGRHWPKLFNNKPAGLTGFDVSAGMLRRLEQKFPNAKTNQITDNLFKDTGTATYDVIVSTLTVAHIENIDEALHAWSRILKYNGDIIITDFHPNALAFGGRRTFEHKHSSIAIQNFVHYVYDIESILFKHGFRIVNKLERKIDESVKHYYEAKNALPVYERFKDARIIYGIHLKRSHDIK